MNVHGERFRAFIAQKTGVELEAGREYLIGLRLANVLRKSGLADLDALLFKAMSERDEKLTASVVEAMLTGETFFFRDRQIFASFAETILPALMEARAESRRLRIWSAACSSGQEPYSIAMLLDEESRKLRGWQIDLIASDVALGAIEASREGYFNQFEVQRGLPVNLLLRYFRREGERWRIAEFLRSRIEFRLFNLVRDIPDMGRFDVIFCRNVLMYFDAGSKKKVIERLVETLEDGGALILGATENISGLSAHLDSDPKIPGCYRRRARAASEFSGKMLLPLRA